MGTALPVPGSYSANIGWPMGASFPGTNSPITKHNGFMGLVNRKRAVSWHSERVAAKDVTDGLSNTAAVSERMINNLVPSRGFFGGEFYAMTPANPIAVMSFCGGSTGGSRALDRWITYCGGVTSPDPRFSKPHGKSWISGWTLVANTYMHVFPPNERNCHLYGGEDDGTNIVTPSSHHVGGLHTLMGDGRVIFNTVSIDRPLWWSIGSRNGLEDEQFE